MVNLQRFLVMEFFKMLKKKIKYNDKISSWKLHTLSIICVVFIMLLIIFSKTAVNSAVKGMDLWFNIVFPSIFPFLVATEILSNTNFIKTLGVLLEPVMRPLFNAPGCASFPFAVGITSGYPVGAKVIANMKENGLINSRIAERLLAFCNNSSPLFIMGAVSIGMLKMPDMGPLLYICHIAAGITIGFIFRFYKLDKKNMLNKKSSGNYKSSDMLLINNNYSLNNLGSLLTNAVKNSVTSLLMVGGFIILFSVIINLLIETGIIVNLINVFYPILKYTGLSKEFFISLFSGFIEITTGLKMLSGLSDIPLNIRLAAISAVLGWGGISVHMQIYSVISNTNLSIKPYLIGKFLQSLISAFYTLIGFKIATAIPQPAASVLEYFSINVKELTSWDRYFFASCRHLSLLLLFFMSFIIVVIALSLIKHLLNKFLRA